jgi:hypothetical protein
VKPRLRTLWCGLLASLVTVGCSSSVPPNQTIDPNGRIAEAGRRARQQGLSQTVWFLFTDVPGWRDSLAQVADQHGVVLAQAVEPIAAVTAGDSIWTWHRLRLTEGIRSPDAPSDACAHPAPPRPLEGPDEWWLPLAAGSVTTEGTTVRMQSPWSDVHFDKDRKYLIFADQCPGGILDGHLAPHGVFAIDESGRLTPSQPLAENSPPFVQDVIRLATTGPAPRAALPLKTRSHPARADLMGAAG